MWKKYWPTPLATPMIRCDQIQFEFLGLSMAGWNGLLSLSGAAVIGWLLLRGARGRA